VLSGTDEATISNAQITLEDSETKISRTTRSDDTGAFSFLAVAPGRYFVRITAPSHP
jgi:hypothetical protein